MKVLFVPVVLIVIVGVALLFLKAPDLSRSHVVHPAGWLTDWKEASTKAAATQRPILADFTGSDWCSWCSKLHQEVFDTPEFTAWAKDHVVLLEVDFPQSKPLPEGQSAANQKLAQQYNIEGFPTILLLNSNGKELGRLGYKNGGPKPWIADAEKMLVATAH